MRIETQNGSAVEVATRASQVVEAILQAGASVEVFKKGEQGDSAYQVAVNNGFIGTEAEWLVWMKGWQVCTQAEHDAWRADGSLIADRIYIIIG
jgi:hypothetical protein